jgi:tryptophan synthase alpha chain
MNGLERINTAFKKNNRIKLMTHIVAGYPSLAESENIVRAMAASGADIVEVQIPFSDPTADGPSIVKANTDALRTGISTDQALNMIAGLASSLDIPILVMSYLNPIFAYGAERFIKYISSKGISGVIIPDCPPEDDLNIITICNAEKIAFVPLVCPTTPDARILEISQKTSSPFVYAVTRLGITGKKTDISVEGKDYLKKVKDLSGKYCAAGFGIREKSQIDAINDFADCAIVGSAITDTIRSSVENKQSPSEKVSEFVKKLI